METLFNVPFPVCKASSHAPVRQDTVHRKTRVAANPFRFGVSLRYILSSLTPNLKSRAAGLHRIQITMPQDKCLGIATMQVIQ